jgi:16S rRNA (uracil1498-N3)-methyltransferase
MSLPRFHLTPEAWRPEILVLEGDEALHCARVLRKAPGDKIEIFDGVGRVATATLTDVSKNSVTARIDEVKQHASRVSEVHLLAAMIKAEAFEWLLEKAAELGAASVRPVVTARSVVHLDGSQLNKKLCKWRRHMVESAKQCHTPWVPALEPPASLAEVLERLPASSVRLMPALSEHSRRLHELDFSAALPVFVLVGPEGDFTEEEEELARLRGFQPVTLGSLILRAETASIAALAIIGEELVRQGRAQP